MTIANHMKYPPLIKYPFSFSVELLTLIPQATLRDQTAPQPSRHNPRGAHQQRPRVYLRDITRYRCWFYPLPKASANGCCHSQVNLTRRMLDSGFTFPGEGLWSTFFVKRQASNNRKVNIARESKSTSSSFVFIELYRGVTRRKQKHPI